MTTCPSAEVAGRLARSLVERRLAGCVQSMPIASTYRWEGSIHHDHEVLVLIKTTSVRSADVVEAVGEFHPYEVPEILVLPTLGASPPYLEWLRAESSPD